MISKHIHLLGALPNIFFRNLSNRKMDLPKLDLEDENQWGVSRIEQFSWKSLSDTYACTECARCSNYCPAYNTEKNLSPMQLIHDLRYEMIDRDALQQQQQTLEDKIETLTKKATNNPSGIYTNALTTAQNSLKEVLQQKKDMEPLVGDESKKTHYGRVRPVVLAKKSALYLLNIHKKLFKCVKV